MNSVSATVNGSVINIVEVAVEGCQYHMVYIDTSGTLKLTRGYIDNTPGTLPLTLGTSAKAN